MRFFFDVVGDHRDRVGTEFVDQAAMENAALRLLLEVALDKTKSSAYDLTLDVRDAGGDYIYRARLRLGGIWIKNTPSRPTDF